MSRHKRPFAKAVDSLLRFVALIIRDKFSFKAHDLKIMKSSMNYFEV